MPSAADARIDRLPAGARGPLVAALELTARRPAVHDRHVQADEREAWRRASAAVGFVEHDPRTGGSFSARIIPLATELSPDQRRFAEIFAEVPGVHLDVFPMYSAAWVRRQWIGLDPPGPLFREVEVVVDGVARRWPMFHALRALVRSDEAAARAEVERLPIGERLPLLAELRLAGLDYWVSHVEAMLVGIAPGLGAEGRAWGPGFADRLLALFADPYHDSERGNHKGIPADLGRVTLAAIVRGGIAVEPRWDVLLSFGYGEVPADALDGIAAIPTERRGAAIAGALARTPFTSDAVAQAVALLPRHAHPEIARFAFDYLDHARRPKDVEKAIAAVALAVPAIAEVVRAAGAATPTLALTERRALSVLAELDEAARAQLEEANARYGGQRMTAAELFAAEETDEVIAPSSTERWRVVDDGGRLLFDAWLYMGDSGTCFRPGTTEVVAEIIQGGVQAADATLKRALTQALSERPRETVTAAPPVASAPTPKPKPKSTPKPKPKPKPTPTPTPKPKPKPTPKPTASTKPRPAPKAKARAKPKPKPKK